MRNEPARRYWRVLGASVAGRSHRCRQLDCQDACHWREVPGGVLLAAAADGAGSASLSHLGALEATQTVIQAAAEALSSRLPETATHWQELLRVVFQQASTAVKQRARREGVAVEQLATTLLLAVATPTELAAAQVGDGAVVIRCASDRYQALTRPLAQEYVNETTFLTSAGYQRHLQQVVHPGAITGLALLTDGLQMLALTMPQGEPHAAFFSPLLRLLAAAPNREIDPAQLGGFLQSPRVAERTDDDLTLLLAVPENVGPPPMTSTAP